MGPLFLAEGVSLGDLRFATRGQAGRARRIAPRNKFTSQIFPTETTAGSPLRFEIFALKKWGVVFKGFGG